MHGLTAAADFVAEVIVGAASTGEVSTTVFFPEARVIGALPA